MSNLTVAETTLKQMGGMNRLKALIGAKNFQGVGGALYFRWPLRAKNRANTLRITLLPSDTYKMEFLYVRGVRSKIIETLEYVYAEDLVRLFEAATGLYLNAIPVSRVIR